MTQSLLTIQVLFKDARKVTFSLIMLNELSSQAL